MVDITELIPNPRNPNRHPDKQVALLAKIIRSQGWRSPVVVSKRSGFVVKGHGRLMAAKLLQVQAVPVDDQDYENEACEWADLIADNRIAEFAETDDALLRSLLTELDAADLDLELAAVSRDEIADLLGEVQSGGLENDIKGINYREQFAVLVTCKDEQVQAETFEKLQALGYECKILVT